MAEDLSKYACLSDEELCALGRSDAPLGLDNGTLDPPRGSILLTAAVLASDEESRLPGREVISDRLRFDILRRDKFRCQTCGGRAPSVRLEIDHRVSVADGGSSDETNLWSLCFRCNRGKGERSL